MNTYRVTWFYVRTDARARRRGDVKIIAKNAQEAREAFTATHPDGSNFHYAIVEVEAIALSELF